MGISPLISKRTDDMKGRRPDLLEVHHILDPDGYVCANENGKDEWTKLEDAMFYARHFAKDGRAYKLRTLRYRLSTAQYVDVTVEGGA